MQYIILYSLFQLGSSKTLDTSYIAGDFSRRENNVIRRASISLRRDRDVYNRKGKKTDPKRAIFFTLIIYIYC